jgi:hypothetical protein
MARCEVCGNDYDKPIEVSMKGRVHLFDCFECAIHALAPLCAHCGVRVVGHGVEGAGAIYCGAHCATKHGEAGLTDRAFHGLSGVR